VPYLMKPNAVQLIIAGALLSFPIPAYVPLWVFGLAVAVEVILSARVTSAVSLLAGRVSGHAAAFGGVGSVV
jgi:hypothetical protein